MNEKELKTVGYIVLGLIAVVVLFMLLSRVFKGLDNFLNLLGITDSKATEEAKKGIEDETTKKTQPDKSAFDPNYYKQKGVKALKTKAGAEILAADIKNSVAHTLAIGWDDNWAKIDKTFSYMTAKSHVSQVADAFRRLYNKDLLTFLTDLANYDSEKVYLSNIIDRVNNLPTGK